MNVFVHVISLLLLEGLVFLFMMTCEFVSKHTNMCLAVFVNNLITKLLFPVRSNVAFM